MNKKLVLLCALLLAVFGTSGSLQADFIMCSGLVLICVSAGDDDDIIQGSPESDQIFGGGGNDFISGGAGMDEISGEEGDDTIFGGPDSDAIDGGPGNDHLLLGPDQPIIAQFALGGDGNDFVYSFAGETFFCLFIDGEGGNDTTNLIGFGPYSAEKPFGQPGFGVGFIAQQDPITGGVVLIAVIEDSDAGTEHINGLTTPNPSILDELDPIVTSCQTSLTSTPGPTL